MAVFFDMPPRCRMSVGVKTSQTTGLPGQHSLVTKLSETVVTVSLSAHPTIACSEQLAHSRTAETISKPRHPFPINDSSLDTD